MANKKYFVDVNLQANDIINLKADALDITSNLASANTKRIVYWSGQYYYSDGTTWIALGNTGSLPTGGATGDILAKASGTDYDVEWISNYTSTVQHEVKAGVAITKGQAVYVSSADGTNMIVSKASNASEATSSKTMGLAASSAALNGIIFVITEGLLTGTGGAPLDTSTATAGDPVWLGTDGNLLFGLANKPVAPAHLVFIGIVTRSSATVGEIFVKVQNGYELNEIHDVLISNPLTDQIIKRDSDGLWKNWTPDFTTGSGTTNKLTKWTSASVLGDSLFEDNGTRLNIGGTYISNTVLSIQSGINNLYGINVLSSSAALTGTVLSDFGVAVLGYATNGKGVYGESSSSEIGFNVGVNGKAFQTDLPAYATNRGGVFEAYGGAFNYSVQLIDGTETVAGRFLKNMNTSGDANWATLTVADTGLTITTTGTSGAATLVGNTLNIPQYSGGSGIDGSGTTNYISKFTASGTIGNSLIQDNGTGIGINIAPQVGSRVYIGAGNLTGLYSSASTPGKNAVYGSNIGDDAGNRTAAFFEAYPADTAINTNIYIAGRFYADGPFAYAIQLQDATEGVDKFLKSVTSDGKANWATMSVADTGLTITNTGTNGAATLVGNTLNIPTYESSLIPKMSGNEIWRGSTYRNNSTTVDTTSGLTVTPTGTPTARAVATTSYATRSIRLGITASLTTTGRYSGIRGSALLWYVTGGFLYTGEFNISDTSTAVGTHNFWGLASSTSDLVIGDIGNSQPSALLNIIAFANDSGDANLQIMHNDASGTATKTDLGASFPSNRTAGAAITTIYSCYLYNAPASSNVIYRIVNKETGAVAQGTLSTNLPASTVGLNFFGARTMGTSGGGINNSGQFDVYRLGVYSL